LIGRGAPFRNTLLAPDAADFTPLCSVWNRFAFQQAEPRTQEILPGGGRFQRAAALEHFAFRASQSIQPMASMLKPTCAAWTNSLTKPPKWTLEFGMTIFPF
jgi:hypothetical protein